MKLHYCTLYASRLVYHDGEWWHNTVHVSFKYPQYAGFIGFASKWPPLSANVTRVIGGSHVVGAW